MKVLFSTSSVHARDRLDFWRDEASKVSVAHEFNTDVGRSFRGRISAGTLGPLSLAILECDACAVGRTERCIRCDTDDDLLLYMQLGGGVMFRQDGREAVVGTNDVFLVDPRRPSSMEVATSTRSLVIKVPRWELQVRLGDVAALTARPIGDHEPLGALAVGFLGMLPQRLSALQPFTGLKIAQQALDLVALALGSQTRNGVSALSSQRMTTLLRLKAIIESRLCDPALRPALAADAAGISVRYANTLLAQEGTSLERFIMLRRLQLCRRILEDPAHALRPASDIAYSCGFSDASHFTRRFKAQFGCSPGECRPRPQRSESHAGPSG
jgi:AraC family transcriptional regulator, positive regulator of tynA and feaB